MTPREKRRHQFIEENRHEYLGLITDALVQARDRTGAELSMWLGIKAQRINKLLGQMFDEFVLPEPVAEPQQKPPVPQPKQVAAPPANGQPQRPYSQPAPIAAGSNPTSIPRTL